MPFLLTLFLLAVSAPMIVWPEPVFGPDPRKAALATGGVTLLLSAAAALVARRAVNGLRRGLPRDHVGKKYVAGRNLLFFANILGFSTSLASFGWGWFVQTQCVSGDQTGGLRLWPFAELVLLGPFLFILFFSWMVHYDADSAFHVTGANRVSTHPPEFWTRRGYIFHHLRQNMLLIFLPVLLMVCRNAAARLFPLTFDRDEGAWLPILLLPVVLLFLPLALPRLLGLEKLPPGPATDRMHAKARRLGLRYRGLLLWPTRGATATAMVVGLLPQARYIIFTDRLLDELDADEVDSVLGHEIGHVHHRHLLYYLVFLMLSIMLLGTIAEMARLAYPEFARDHPNRLYVLPFLALAVYMFGVFGILSRNCERQADVFGCKAVSCSNPKCGFHTDEDMEEPFHGQLCEHGIRIFVQALQRVGIVNGLFRDHPRWGAYRTFEKPVWIFHTVVGWLGTWQHSTIENRVRYLEGLAKDPTREPRFQQGMFFFKFALLASLVFAMAWIGTTWGWETILGGVVESVPDSNRS